MLYSILSNFIPTLHTLFTTYLIYRIQLPYGMYNNSRYTLLFTTHLLPRPYLISSFVVVLADSTW
jgi:hypothetical protein